MVFAPTRKRDAGHQTLDGILAQLKSPFPYRRGIKSSAKYVGLLCKDKLAYDKRTVANMNIIFTRPTLAASLAGILPNITGGNAGNTTRIKVLNKTHLNCIMSEKNIFKNYYTV